jgi:hypothetical protein
MGNLYPYPRGTRKVRDERYVSNLSKPIATYGEKANSWACQSLGALSQPNIRNHIEKKEWRLIYLKNPLNLYLQYEYRRSKAYHSTGQGQAAQKDIYVDLWQKRKSSHSFSSTKLLED